MNKTKVYHGWIYIEKTPGMNDFFIAQWRATDGPHSLKCGYRSEGAEMAVDHFETTLGLGPVRLEEVPILGLRVYTEKEEEK